MGKLSKILKLAELFYNKALLALGANPDVPYVHTMPDDPEDLEEDIDYDSKNISGNIEADAERFEDMIVNDKLHKQFQDLMSQYKELMNYLTDSPSNFSYQATQKLVDLENVFKTKYGRLIENPYLSEGKDWKEHFDSGEFTELLQNIWMTVGKNIGSLESNNMSLEDIKKSNLPEVFNTQNPNNSLEGNAGAEEWSAEKIAKVMASRKKWYDDIMKFKNFKEPNESSSKEYAKRWNQYQKHVNTRKAWHKKRIEMLKADPELYQEYKEKAKQYHKKWRDSPENKNKLKELAQKYIDKRKEKWESKSLEGYISVLLVKRDNKKSDVAKRIRKMAIKAFDGPEFSSIKLAHENAKKRFDEAPSEYNKQLLDTAEMESKNAIKNYINNHEAAKEVANDMSIITSYINKLNTIVVSLKDPEPVDNDTVYKLINEGAILMKQFDKKYAAISESLNDIVNELKTIVNGNQ